MSGIFGFVHLDGAPAERSDLERMARLMERRGPDGTGLWLDGSVALGHTLLATTPESLNETLPLRHSETGCVITADVRLDNRPELMAALGDSRRLAEAGDGTLLLEAYLRWGDACVDHLLGDFAFAIWDPRHRRLFAARDHMGMRQLIHHHQEGRFFAFATEPRAVLALPRTPYRINEARIADFLVNPLEGVDKTSTFFEEVFRLPPGHTTTLGADRLQHRHYWRPEPQPELQLESDDAYAEAFLEVFTEAVRCRLRSTDGSLGSMLSGGMDSGSIVAVARGILAAEGRGPLKTFSAVGPDAATCRETRTIHAALTMGGIDPQLIDYTRLGNLLPALTELMWAVDEPFDGNMNLARAVYLSASRHGIKVMLDGAGGDTLLSEGSHLRRLIASGKWLRAWNEAIGQKRFWGPSYRAWKLMFGGIRSAATPNWLRRRRRNWLNSKSFDAALSKTLISATFAERVGLRERLERLSSHRSAEPVSFALERAEAVGHPFLTVGRERYDRVAAGLAIEARDPTLDIRLIEFATSLPGSQLLGSGWPKIVLRRAMDGLLPDEVRWRTGKEHLGPSFTKSVCDAARNTPAFNNSGRIFRSCFDELKLKPNSTFWVDQASDFWLPEVSCLSMWLDRHDPLCQIDLSVPGDR
jgi:asparagine synthase (glutamine-hydrolysing)